MTVLIVLFASWLGFWALGALGVEAFAGWSYSAHYALAVMFLFTGFAHFTKMKHDLVLSAHNRHSFRDIWPTPRDAAGCREPYCERNRHRANSEPSSNHPLPLGLAGGNACDFEFVLYLLEIGSKLAGSRIALHAILLKCPPNDSF